MKPRRTHSSNGVAHLPGHSEDYDMWFMSGTDENGNKVISIVWEPTPEERAAIAAGANIRVNTWTTRDHILPMAVEPTDELLGKPPDAPKPQ